MSVSTLSEFVNKTAQDEAARDKFQLESDHMLEINLNGLVWTKIGSMVAYTGNIKFEREGALEHGIGKFLKKQLTGEGTTLTKANGTGRLYLADYGKMITILRLTGDTINVNGNDLLAFEDGINWDIKLMRRMTSMLSGGLFNVEMSGTGMIAITSHYQPLTLKVTSQNPVITDPNATIAWSGNLSPELRTDVNFKTFLGRGSGESIQMLFRGDGFVVVQPYEEIYLPQSQSQGS
ncbi:MAG: AIM24 family protein [Armatimonadota bacterium]